ncbi:Eco57I restriction-modification methylase domain-containing protein [Rodentibacter haemolyticus]|uniref:site-specific DNA-methyltransferase (adenine-specific) n=1 Tax=Rodentibacter haemolyticus TaxID=2778911 RepID=A0ABX6UZG8_9PAST|nr:Eco57I restriction-modification methylase domain-containing protein [Rodentibacter haemolyticus]QPB42854.1 Eco57I restriction-modification methylase domain-containing protein [Rodentibacter haemolyticus]
MDNTLIDDIRLKINKSLNPYNKSKYAQFMTPSVIADFMANLFDNNTSAVKLLDCGAGIGSLSISAVKKLKNISLADLWEIDPIMQEQLEVNMKSMNIQFSIHTKDFIFDAVENILSDSGERYTHAIINPPYKKISSSSKHRKELRKIGIETVNLYSAFLALTIMLMQENGQVVAIIPRSFCNGPYYKPFRELLLKECSIEHIHIFKSRNSAFKDDDVLQENIILKIRKGKQQNCVVISQSNDSGFYDLRQNLVQFHNVVKPNDMELFIRIPTDEIQIDNNMFQASLSELGLNVSTGPVVDFRMKQYLQQQLTDDAVPLLYPHHFANGRLQYPKEHKKPNAIIVSPESQKWLLPNNGYYVIVKRFSAKEEKRRVVAYVVNPDEIGKQWIGFENHWNVFHIKKRGFDKETAMGLACFLNSTALNDHFRVFSGHTQVNATDLKNMHYPSMKILHELGKSYRTKMNQEQIDTLLAGVMN